MRFDLVIDGDIVCSDVSTAQAIEFFMWVVTFLSDEHKLSLILREKGKVIE